MMKYSLALFIYEIAFRTVRLNRKRRATKGIESRSGSILWHT
jgi:hypothetical protein